MEEKYLSKICAVKARLMALQLILARLKLLNRSIIITSNWFATSLCIFFIIFGCGFGFFLQAAGLLVVFLLFSLANEDFMVSVPPVVFQMDSDFDKRNIGIQLIKKKKLFGNNPMLNICKLWLIASFTTAFISINSSLGPWFRIKDQNDSCKYHSVPSNAIGITMVYWQFGVILIGLQAVNGSMARTYM